MKLNTVTNLASDFCHYLAASRRIYPLLKRLKEPFPGLYTKQTLPQRQSQHTAKFSLHDHATKLSLQDHAVHGHRESRLIYCDDMTVTTPTGHLVLSRK